MSEQQNAEKYDFTESDLILQQLRAQLESNHGKITDLVATQEEPRESEEALPLSEIVTTEADTPTGEADDASGAEKSPTAEEEPRPVIDEADFPSIQEATEAPTEDDVAQADPVRRARRRRKTVPKPGQYSAQQSVAPLGGEALAARKKRADAIAEAEKDDLFWRAIRQDATKANGAVGTEPVDSPEQEPAVAPEEGTAEVQSTAAEKPQKAPPRQSFKAYAEEELAGFTVEGLMTDIFGTPKKAPVAPPAPEEIPPTVTVEGQPAMQEQAPEAEEPDKKGAEKDKDKVKLFHAFGVKRNVNKEEPVLPRPSISRLSAERMAFKRSLEESEEDFRLLMDLDYEDELGHAIGFEKIREYHEKEVNGKLIVQEGEGHIGRFEYGSRAQNIGLSKFYAKQRSRRVIDLAVTAFLTVLLFVYERSALLQQLLGAPRQGYKYATGYLALGLLLFLVSIILLRRQIFDGIRRLLQFSPVDYSLCAVVVTVTLLYHIALFFVPPESEMVLYLSPAAGYLALLALSNLFDWYREFSAFRVISSKSPKYVLMSRISVGSTKGDAKLRLFDEDERRETEWFVRPVDFVRNFFGNTSTRVSGARSVGAQLLLVLAVSVVLALFSFVLGASAPRAIHIAFVTFLLTLPATSVLATTLPMFCATCLCLKRNSAIIGEAPVYGSQERSVLVLPDHECFAPMLHEQFELVKNCDPTRSMVLIRALLERLESPLAASVHVPKEARMSPDAITLTDVDTFGVGAAVREDKKTSILLGSVEYLQKYGIRVAPKKDGRYDEISRHMLCVAINNRLTALFVARYRAHEEMAELIETLQAEGLQPVIRTKDPGIHNEMLAELFPDADPPVTVMKPQAAESDINTERVDATVVALGSSREAARAFATCRRTHRAVRFGRFIQVLSFLLGSLLAGALTVTGVIAATPAFAVTLWAVVWCGVYGLASYLYLRSKDE